MQGVRTSTRQLALVQAKSFRSPFAPSMAWQWATTRGTCSACAWSSRGLLHGLLASCSTASSATRIPPSPGVLPALWPDTPFCQLCAKRSLSAVQLCCFTHVLRGKRRCIDALGTRSVPCTQQGVLTGSVKVLRHANPSHAPVCPAPACSVSTSVLTTYPQA